jgi:hypothetical protein
MPVDLSIFSPARPEPGPPQTLLDGRGHISRNSRKKILPDPKCFKYFTLQNVRQPSKSELSPKIEARCVQWNTVDSIIFSARIFFRLPGPKNAVQHPCGSSSPDYFGLAAAEASSVSLAARWWRRRGAEAAASSAWAWLQRRRDGDGELLLLREASAPLLHGRPPRSTAASSTCRSQQEPLLPPLPRLGTTCFRLRAQLLRSARAHGQPASQRQGAPPRARSAAAR